MFYKNQHTATWLCLGCFSVVFGLACRQPLARRLWNTPTAQPLATKNATRMGIDYQLVVSGWRRLWRLACK